MNELCIQLDETLRCQLQDAINEKEISVSVADNLLKKIAFNIAQQKRAMGMYNDTEYLMHIPGMKEILLEGLATPLSECVDEGDLWADV